MHTLAIANAKGGVGKTATAHALGSILAAGLRVLLVDVDPQSSLSQACGITSPERSLADVLGGSSPGRMKLGDIVLELEPGPAGAPAGSAVSSRAVASRLDLAPSDITLAAAELGLTSRLGREGVLKKALSTVVDIYDLVIIDCPPSLGLLTVGALVAADAVLIPTQPQAADLRGLRLFLATLDQIRSELNPGLDLLGILVTFYDQRLNHHQEAIEAMQRAGLPLLDVKIGRSVKVAEAAGARRPVTTYAPGNPRAAEYNLLAEVVRSWLRNATQD